MFRYAVWSVRSLRSRPARQSWVSPQQLGPVELSVGDPDVTWSADTGAWQACWSTGLAASYTSPMTMAIKRAASSDGVHWNVQAEHVLYAGGSDSDWDYSNRDRGAAVAQCFILAETTR